MRISRKFLKINLNEGMLDRSMCFNIDAKANLLGEKKVFLINGTRDIPKRCLQEKNTLISIDKFLITYRT